MDKAMASSILAEWAQNTANPERQKWCYDKLLAQFLTDERATISFIRNEQSHENLDLIAQLLPELAYQYNSHIFLRQMENICAYHNSDLWLKNLAKALTKVKTPEIDRMDF